MWKQNWPESTAYPGDGDSLSSLLADAQNTTAKMSTAQEGNIVTNWLCVCVVRGLYKNLQHSADYPCLYHATVPRDGTGDSPLSGYECDALIWWPLQRGKKTEQNNLVLKEM
jgi:hypothetical protein